ncbi:MAG: uroporphyrinogen-III C-methyltransferase, partial [Candidatus Omnitrophica bacterium CG12_big_fil_rev_8_21_14_0_65_50_5]
MAEQPSKTIRAGSRSSRLALLQVEEIESLLKAQGMTAAFEKVRFETKGDRDKTTPLAQSADDFFTDVLDQALLDGKIDIAIHSAKDLPQNLHPGLKIF